MYKTMHLKSAIIIEIIHLGSLYLCGMQKLEHTSLVSFEIWKVGVHTGTANPCFPQNINTCYFLGGVRP